MSAVESVDIGCGFTLTEFRHGDEPELAGYLIQGPSTSGCDRSHLGRCGGLIPIRAYGDRPVWTVVSEEPLTLTPSVRCACGGQHGYVRDGRYVPV